MNMRWSGIVAALLFAGSTSVAAQPAPAAPAAEAAALPAPDPERLAAAERLVDRIWPLGTYRRMMAATMESTIGAFGGIEEAVAEAGYSDDKATRRAQHEARTGRPLPGSADRGPAVDPQAAVAEINAALGPVFERIEPPLRAAVARIYARRYNLTQLAELDAFFSTPTGAAYAADSLTLMTDPEMLAAMRGSMGEVMGTLLGLAEAESSEATAAADAAAIAAVEAAVAAAAKAE